MARTDDPLAMFLFLVARNGLPWGAVEKLLDTATSEIVPDPPPNDPLWKWAQQAADTLR